MYIGHEPGNPIVEPNGADAPRRHGNAPSDRNTSASDSGAVDVGSDRPLDVSFGSIVVSENGDIYDDEGTILSQFKPEEGHSVKCSDPKPSSSAMKDKDDVVKMPSKDFLLKMHEAQHDFDLISGP